MVSGFKVMRLHFAIVDEYLFRFLAAIFYTHFNNKLYLASARILRPLLSRG